ncbi:26398_t:CDS:2, partial [Gigaspora margarita]
IIVMRKVDHLFYDDIYTLPESLGIQETKQTSEVAQSIRFQPTEIESLLSFDERLTGSPLSFGEKFLESDESNLTRVSLISQDNETTQETPVFEVTSSYQGRDDEESKSSVPQMAPDTTTEEIIAENGNALIEVSENFDSFALGEPTKAFNASGSRRSVDNMDFDIIKCKTKQLHLVYRERSSVNVSTSALAFGKPKPFGAATSVPIFITCTQPAFGQPAFGQPAFGQPAFGQPAFGQPAFGQPAFGQPAFGQHGFGQARPFGTPAVLSTALKAKVVADLLGSQ